MKESRFIIFISIIILALLIPGFYILTNVGVSENLSINIITNLGCGVIVALVTAMCQYFIARRRIVSTVYGFYFELYTTYYSVKNKEFFHHFNSYAFISKLTELSTKIKDTLFEYHGFFKREDSMYMKMNPPIALNDNYKAKNFINTLVRWFNEGPFNESIEPFMKDIENILKNINEKRFEEDKRQMINIFNYIWK